MSYAGKRGIEHLTNMQLLSVEDNVGDAELIISDCTLPGFDSLSAFSIAAAVTPEIPFVFISGTLGDERAREALKHGAAGYVAKGNHEHLAQTIRSALERGPPPHRRASDRSLLWSGADAGTGAAQHLLARRKVLDETLQQRDSPAMTSTMLRTAPSPAALLMIEARLTRDRFAKLLPLANLEIETARNADEALER